MYIYILYIYIVYIYVYIYIYICNMYIHMCLWNPKDSSKHWSHLCEIGLVASHLGNGTPRSEDPIFGPEKMGTSGKKQWKKHGKNIGKIMKSVKIIEQKISQKSEISGNRPSKRYLKNAEIEG